MKGQFKMKDLLSKVPTPIHTTKRKKKSIPTALREAVWIKHMGRNFEGKCRTTWCQNTITAFEFQAGHDIPESKGGSTDISNLYPICSRCNLSMSNHFTFSEWCKLGEVKPEIKSEVKSEPRKFSDYFRCFKPCTS